MKQIKRLGKINSQVFFAYVCRAWHLSSSMKV